MTLLKKWLLNIVLILCVIAIVLILKELADRVDTTINTLQPLATTV